MSKLYIAEDSVDFEHLAPGKKNRSRQSQILGNYDSNEDLEPAAMLTTKKTKAHDDAEEIFEMEMDAPDLVESPGPGPDETIHDLLYRNAAIDIQMRAVVEAAVELHLHDIVRETYQKCTDLRVAAAEAQLDEDMSRLEELEEDMDLVLSRRSLLEAEIADTDRLTRESNGCAFQLTPTEGSAVRRPQLDLVERSESSMFIPELVSHSPEKVIKEHLKKPIRLNEGKVHEEQILNEEVFLTKLDSLKSHGKRRYAHDCVAILDRMKSAQEDGEAAIHDLSTDAEACHRQLRKIAYQRTHPSARPVERRLQDRRNRARIKRDEALALLTATLQELIVTRETQQKKRASDAAGEIGEHGNVAEDCGVRDEHDVRSDDVGARRETRRCSVRGRELGLRRAVEAELERGTRMSACQDGHGNHEQADHSGKSRGRQDSLWTTLVDSFSKSFRIPKYGGS